MLYELKIHPTTNFFVAGDPIEGFQSLIWTDRFDTYGDIQIVTISTPENRRRLAEGTWLGYSESDRIMQIRTLTDYVDESGRSLLKAVGPSLEKVYLGERSSAAAPFNGTGFIGKGQTFTGTPGDIARQLIFQRVRAYPTVIDGLPGYQTGTFYPADTIPEPTESIRLLVERADMLTALQSIIKPYEMGLRIVMRKNSPVTGAEQGVYIDIYTGNNLTRAQSLVDPVIFAPELDNLTNPSSFESGEDYRNMCYVYAPYGSVVVYLGETPPVAFDRRIMVLNIEEEPDFSGTASEITAQRLAYLTQKGKEALIERRRVSLFEGEIGQYSKYKPGIDYNVGDLVELRNKDKATKYMRVIEQIYVEDEQGKRSYPTLGDVSLITPGTWGAIDYSLEWGSTPDAMNWANASN